MPSDPDGGQKTVYQARRLLRDRDPTQANTPVNYDFISGMIHC